MALYDIRSSARDMRAAGQREELELEKQEVGCALRVMQRVLAEDEYHIHPGWGAWVWEAEMRFRKWSNAHMGS